MGKRTIYVNPGDMVEVRIITDKTEPKTAAAWDGQSRPDLKRMLLQFGNSGQQLYATDPALQCFIQCFDASSD